MKQGLLGLWRYLWKYRSRVIPGVLLVLCSDAGQLAIPKVVARVIDALDSPHPDLAYTGHMCGWILGLAAAILVSRFLWRHFMFSAARQAEQELREGLLRQVLSLPSEYFTRTRTGEIMALATNDLISVRTALAMGVVAGFDATLLALATLVLMALMDLRLTLWAILPFPALAVVIGISLKLIYTRWDGVQKAFEELTEKVRESLSGIRVLKAYRQEEGDCRDFERSNERNYQVQMTYARVDSVYQPSIVVLAGSSVAILIWVGGAEVVAGRLSLGNFNAFVSYLGMLTWPMIAAGWMVSLLQRGAASMNRILTVLALSPESSEGAGGDPPRGELQARHLTFTYPGESRPALVDLDFHLAAGGSLGLVGEVGSGKSTLVQLLNRIQEPEPGQLFLDGRDVRELNLGYLRQAISYVPQEAFLFSETIEENLRLGQAEADPERLRWACVKAALDQELSEFPQGYQTLLGERGITLSGGQKQRLCLARALLKNSPIIVLDDTLSAVDAHAEQAVLAELKGALGGRTTVVISHRVSSVRDLDWILVLEEGRVVQQGRHQDLVGQTGYYRDMYELQALEEGQPTLARGN